ncbi:MAG TPA: Gfo/Idh/MocA family oxidoreductase [Planctomycetota bacterium]|nr:Gfo/Idh/MocA family oxidoreductase [Planctomycetota bacterium]
MPRPKRAAPPAPERVIRVAFIGAGARATMSHYPSIRDLPGAEICAIAELDAAKLRKAAEQFGVKAIYTSHREMLEKERPDVVYAIMPPHHLYDVAFAVMSAGCHLIIEKPPAVAAEQTRQMAVLARKKGLITGVTLQRRYSPVVRAARKLCEERGPVHSAVATFYKNTVGAGPYYGGAMDILTCDAIHAVDTLRYLCGGEVRSVASDVRRLLAEHFTAHYALVRFDSGVTGVLLTNWMAGRRFFTFEVHGTGISVFGDPEEGGKAYADNQKEPLRTLDPFDLAASKEPHRAYGEYDMNAHFLSCVRRGVQPETNLDDAVKTMELVDRIYHSQI